MFVCVNCFEDPGLVSFIKENAVEEECSFCSSKGATPIAASVDEVSEHFLKCLFREYDLAVNQLGWEGGWVGTYWDTDDLVYEIELEFPQDNQDQLLPSLFGEYRHQDWCEAHAYGLNDAEQARFGWEHFCQVVMHQRRYFFLDSDLDPDDPEIYSPGDVLRTIFEYAHQADLFLEMLPGANLFRARWEGGNPHFETAQELGPPPADKATQSNRMSPAGIPMFYACDDAETALRETANGPGYFAVGQFEVLRSVTLLDLSAIQPIPSLFEQISDSTGFLPRRVLTFLNHVVRQIAHPIERGERTHIDYVPTQVVTEFIRDQVTWDGSHVDGIKYSSSVHPGHASYVLFAEQGNLLPAPEVRSYDDRWLELTGIQHHWDDVEWLSSSLVPTPTP